MIKFSTQDGRRRIVGLGLSDENVRRLTAGEPIRVRYAELGLDLEDVEILIFHGPTEADMRAALLRVGAIREDR